MLCVVLCKYYSCILSTYQRRETPKHRKSRHVIRFIQKWNVHDLTVENCVLFMSVIVCNLCVFCIIFLDCFI